LTDAEGAWILGERVRTAVEQTHYEYKQASIAVTISVGMAVAEDAVAAGYELLKHTAAAALREAKETGRNRCIVRKLPADAGVAEGIPLPDNEPIPGDS
jgi:PleD family two-component response regulator